MRAREPHRAERCPARQARAAGDRCRGPRSARALPARRWSMSMFCVMTASSMAARSSSASARCAPLGCLSAASRSGRRRSPRSAPGRRGRRRCGRPPSGRRSPTARCRGARKSGIPDGTEIPAPVSATTEPASRMSSARRARSAWAAVEERAGRASCPLNCAARLPRKAAMPSLASSLAKALAKPCFSASMPASRSPLAETRLICSTASGACPASLRAHASAVSSSSWSGDDAVDEPELERLLGQDRVADQVHLERLVRRRRAAAAAACRRSRG